MSKYFNSCRNQTKFIKMGNLNTFWKVIIFSFLFSFFLMSMGLYWSIQYMYWIFYLVISVSVSSGICMDILIQAGLSLLDLKYMFFFEGVSFFRHALNVIKWSAGTLHLIIHSTSYILRHTIIFYILMSVKEKYLLSGDGNLSLSNFYWMSFEIWS